MDLKAECFNDGSWVIMGDHLSVEDAQKIYEKVDDGWVVSVEHFWVRHQFVNTDEAIELDIEDNGPLWILYETKKRPKGITRKATVLTIDYTIAQNNGSTQKGVK